MSRQHHTGQPVSRQPVPRQYASGQPVRTRSDNERTVLDYLAVHGSATRPELAAAAQITRPAMLELVGRLADQGLVELAGYDTAVRRGPKSARYALAHNLPVVVGMELHPTHAEAMSATLTGQTITHLRLDEPQPEPIAALHNLLDAVLADSGRTRTDLAAVAVGLPGVVDPEAGMLYVSDFPDWQVDRTHLLEGIAAPAVLDNHIRLAALAELQPDLAPPAPPADFAYVYCGNGPAAALVMGGQLLGGSHRAAGEIGFLPLSAAGFATGGDQRPTGLRDYLALTALVHFAREELSLALPADPHQAGAALLDTLSGTPGAASGATLGAASEAAPGTAPGAGRDALLRELARRIAYAVAAIGAIVDPGRVILTGPLAWAGGAELAGLVSKALGDTLPVRPDIHLSSLPTIAAAQGALTRALEVGRDHVFAGYALSPGTPSPPRR